MSKPNFTPGPWSLNRGQNWFSVADVHQNICSMCTPWDAQVDANARLIAAAPALYGALANLNHMGGDESGGYCVCPLLDGIATSTRHASSCADARAALALVEAAQ